jgi:hypothetical protein
LKIIISIFESVKNDCFLGGFSNFNIAEQANIFYKLRKLLAFTEGAVKKVLASLEMRWHSLRELLKKPWGAQKRVDILEGAVKKCWQA